MVAPTAKDADGARFNIVVKDSPEEIGKAVNVNGNVLNQVVNVYNGPVVREAISKSFATVDADDSVDGVSLESDEFCW